MSDHREQRIEWAFRILVIALSALWLVQPGASAPQVQHASTRTMIEAQP
jgi:hypothetical protein